MAKRIHEQNKEENILVMSRLAAESMSSLIATSSSPNRVRLHLKVRGCRWLGDTGAHGAFSSFNLENQERYRIDMGPPSPHIAENIPFFEAVLSMVREIYGRQPGDLMKDLYVNFGKL